MKWIWALAFLVVVAASDPEEDETDPDAFEGDMVLAPAQKAAALSGGDIDAPTKGKPWNRGILVYQIQPALARYSRARTAITRAFLHWSSKTCIRFKKRTNEYDFVQFRIGRICSSHIGRQGGLQIINLAVGCWTAGIVAHEIGHALGFYHEQSRPDRDNYVTIMWNNIIEQNKFNFHKYKRGTIDSLGTPYDYHSLMHYGSTAFSKNRKPTIVAKIPGVTIGQRKGLSTIDARQMNLMYKKQCALRDSGGGGRGVAGSSCIDLDRRCPSWTGYCNSNRYVIAYCRKTCKFIC